MAKASEVVGLDGRIAGTKIRYALMKDESMNCNQ